MAPSAMDQGGFGDDLNDFSVDDFNIDPFGDSGEENGDPLARKNKGADALGIDEAVAVNKKARAPRVKLNDERLLSEKGIPTLRRKAGVLKFKGKGHEFSDTAKLLSFYQLWLDDLFPKAKFLDGLAMIEKAGHTRRLQMARMAWIDEGKPKATREDEDLFAEDVRDEPRDATIFPTRVAPIFQSSIRASERPKTPSIDDLFDDDIYNATPKAAKPAAASSLGNGQPDDEEDLDALLAEEEARRTAPSTSIFGNGQPAQKPVQKRVDDVPDDDDLDALMAMAEADPGPAKPNASTSSAKPKKNGPFVDDDEDDLDALMADFDAQDPAFSAAPTVQSATKPREASSAADRTIDQDEEDAMAEMDGLW